MIRLRTAFKWILFALVLAYVGRHAYRLWNESDVRASLSLAGGGWLLGAACCYMASFLPSVWFWQKLMHSLGGRVKFADAAGAYYCGHLGKYIPGKAMVLVIRSAMVANRGCAAGPAAVTAAFETLTMMGTGLVIGLVFAPAPEWMGSALRASLPAAVLAAAVVGLPFASRLLSWFARRTALGTVAPTVDQRVIPTRSLAAGCAAYVVSWAVQGLSLGLTLHALGVNFDPSQWPLWTGGMALSTSLGFAVLFAPAGLGVREGLLLGVLNGQPGISAHAAVAATVLSRVVSFASELCASAILYWNWRQSGEPAT